MATIVMTYPRDGGTYQTDATGALVPFVAAGYVDVPGAVVSIYEDGTSALLGSGAASSSPEAVGAYAGWYPWAISIASWTTSAGALLPSMSVTGSFAAPSLSASPPLPSMAGTGGLGEITYSSASAFLLPTMSGAGTMRVLSVTAVVSVPSISGTGAMSVATIASAGGSHVAPTVVGASTIALAQSGTIAPALPAGIVAGDLIIAACAHVNPFTPGAAPTGWTRQLGPDLQNLEILSRVATGSDSAPAIAGTPAWAFCFALRGASTSSPIDVFGTAATPGLFATLSSVATVTDNAMVLAIGWFDDAGLFDGETYNNAGTALAPATGAASTALSVQRVTSGATSYGVGAWSSIKSTPGATGTAGITLSSPGDSQTRVGGVLFAVRPA